MKVLKDSASIHVIDIPVLHTGITESPDDLRDLFVHGNALLGKILLGTDLECVKECWHQGSCGKNGQGLMILG